MTYKLTHPDSKAVVEAEADMVAVYVTQGWETKLTAKTPPATDADSVKKK